MARPIRYFPKIVVTDTQNKLIDYYDNCVAKKKSKKSKRSSSGWYSAQSDGSNKILKDLVKALEKKPSNEEAEEQ